MNMRDMIGGPKPPKEEAEGEAESMDYAGEGLLSAADDLISAIKSGSRSAVADALKSAYRCAQSAKDEPAPDEDADDEPEEKPAAKRSGMYR